MPQVEIAFVPVLGDEHFAVLERREASGWCAVKLQKLAGAGTCCDTLRK